MLWLVAKAYGLLLWCYGQMLKYDIHAHRPAQFNEILTPGATLIRIVTRYSFILNTTPIYFRNFAIESHQVQKFLSASRSTSWLLNLQWKLLRDARADFH